MIADVPSSKQTGATVTRRVSVDELRDLVMRILDRLGVPAEAARQQAEVWLEGDLRGHPSHGVQRLLVLASRLRRGLADPKAEPNMTWRTPTVLAVDGRRGLGPVVAFAALEAIADRVATQGIALAAIRNSNHLGMLAPYVERAAERSLVAIATTTSEALVHPWGGRVAMVGTNPLAIAVPAGAETPVLDMATGTMSMGKVIAHELYGVPLPEGAAVDADGWPTTDPSAAKHGAISPFGGAKGYAMSVALELLVASLTATALGREVKGTLDEEHHCNKGDVLLCIDPVMVAGEDVGLQLQGFVEALRACPPAPGHEGVGVPGDGTRATRSVNARDGVPMSPTVLQKLHQLAQADEHEEI